MQNMKVTRQQVVTMVGFIMSPALIVRGRRRASIKFFRLVLVSISAGLLLFAANCSFENKTTDNSSMKQAQEEFFVANAFCSACHYTFGDEELALNHKRVGIGCERCHGESERHRSDEANITPPEIMYTKARINPTCMMCHPRGDIKHVSLHASLLAGAETIFDKSNGQKQYCTDCHGKDHRINVRTIRWNKATGELLEE
jgi:hypothetical protein